jgi:5-methylcytosine-specific restriction endonuclease McrA
MESKTCNKCGEVKPLSEFRIRHKKKNGKEYVFPCGACLDCEHKYHKAKHEERMSNPEYAAYRKAKVAEYGKKFMQTDKGKALYEKNLIEGQKKRDAIPKSHKIFVRTCEVTGKLFIARSERKHPISRDGELILHRQHSRDRRYVDGSNIRNCNWCNKEYDFKIEGTPKYCCESCKRESYRHQHNIQKGKSKAIKKSRRLPDNNVIGWFQNVNPTRVFDRDKWKCQLCGITTPRKMRGTIAPNAPELDHIVPLSRGGIHTYSNTQCLCRQCNGRKGSKLMGQLKMVM